MTDAISSSDEPQARMQRLEMVIDTAGLGVWEWDLRTGELIWNDRNRELFGVDAGRSLTIQDFDNLVHPEDLELVRATYREAAEKPEGGDFTMEYRTVFQPDGKARWLLSKGRVVKGAEGVTLVVGSNLDVTGRKTAEERRNLLLRELSHRAKNGILITMSFVRHTARQASSIEEFETALNARLQSMADSQDLVTSAIQRRLSLSEVLDVALKPFDQARFDLDPQLLDVNIPTDVVVPMALLLHELSTNAVKYGALSEPRGRVKLELAASNLGAAVMGWTEAGGPEVAPATRRGFGTRLLEISLRDYGGHVESTFEPQGFQAKVHFPVTRA